MSERRKSPVDAESITPQTCSTDVRLEVLSRVPFFAGLADEDLRRINRLFREQGFASGEAIYFAGDPAARLYVVAEGKVKLMRHTWAGKDVMLDMLAPGEFFGSLSTLRHDQYPDTAQSQTAACVLSIESEEFRDILKDYPQVALKVLDITSERLKSAHETIRQLSVFSVERRIAHTLLKLGEKLGQQDKVGLLIQVPLSRDDLAEMTGTTTESASRVMSQFQKDGLIESGRQWVAITDLEGLESIAQEDI
jgi:CRP-like cAMP-binding protein